MEKDKPKAKSIRVEIVETPVEETPAAEPVAETPIESEAPANNIKTIIIVTLIFMVLGMVIAGGIITYNGALSKMNASQPAINPQATITPTPTPTVVITTEPEKVDQTSLKIQVLNGSGVGGKAGQAKDYLAGLGYKNLTTGNANTSTYATTTIAIKEDKNSFAEAIIQDLKTKYTLADKTTVLDQKSDFDVVITVGKK